MCFTFIKGVFQSIVQKQNHLKKHVLKNLNSFLRGKKNFYKAADILKVMLLKEGIYF